MKVYGWLILLLVGCEQSSKEQLVDTAVEPSRTVEQRMGAVFTKAPENILALPDIQEIKLPFVENIDAIWGATGRDDEGNIYIGASSHGGDYGSAYLYQYNPTSGELVAQSDVVAQLKANGIYRSGMRQNKLHSKFYQTNDGDVYFSSFDEGGESEGVNPTWGGHLWRKKPDEKNWQHVLATEEALVAINSNGRFVYALGYWNHVLYQYDTQTAEVKRTTVGSVTKHVSRNFLVDEVGHVYVPQLLLNDFNEVETHLIEYDTKLNIVGKYPLPSYTSKNINSHHGIVAYTSMKNGDIFFTASEGGLYQISPFKQGKEKVNYRGMMHPKGQAYIASLFTTDGNSILYGLGREKRNPKNYDWIAYEVQSGESFSKPVDIPVGNPLLYGTLTKANDGNMYIVGWKSGKKQKYSPVFFELKLNY